MNIKTKKVKQAPTPFQQSVWLAVSLIPKGCVTTYGAIAEYLGSRAVRAVATAVGKNPYAPDVPCHRVVLSSGNVGNYSGKGGKETKIKLLQSEGIIIEDDKIKEFNKHMFRLIQK